MANEVEHWLNEWLEVYIKPCRKKNTYLCYKYIIKMVMDIAPQFKTELLTEINELELQKLVNSLSDRYSKSTLKKICGVFKLAYAAAIRNNLCENNPATCLVIPEASEKIIRALTRNEQRLVETAAYNDILGHIVIFLLYTGLRASELINLKWDDYSAEFNEIYIRSSKTKAGLRTVPLLPKAKAIIDKQPHYCDYIFTSTTRNPVTMTVLKKIYKRLRKSTGIPFLTTHVYRHTFATRMVERHADYKALSSILGHKNVAFTLNRYTDTQDEFLHEQIGVLNTPL